MQLSSTKVYIKEFICKYYLQNHSFTMNDFVNIYSLLMNTSACKLSLRMNDSMCDHSSRMNGKGVKTFSRNSEASATQSQHSRRTFPVPTPLSKEQRVAPFRC